jgi:putative SOS response-associated peptidase YedK
MCGRFFLSRSGAEIARHFDLAREPTLAPRYNIAPGQPIALVRERLRDGARERVLEERIWGFVPHWAERPGAGRHPINARAETAATRALFRDAFARRRALVPADGFYEWQHRGRSARPFAVRLRGGGLFAMAALYERWHGPGGPLDTCAILTTAANAPVAAIHDRMPAIVAPADYGIWLDPAAADAELLAALLQPWPDAGIELHPVDRRVNDPHCDDPGLLVPERDLFGGVA